MRRLLPLGSLLCACTPVQTETLPASEAKSMVLVSKGQDGLTALFFAEPPFALPSAPTRTLIFGFDRPLQALGLSPGGIWLAAATARRSPVPAPVSRFELDEAGLRQTATTTSGLELPELDLSAVLRGGCLEAPDAVSTACGPTSDFDSFQVAEPALPDLKDPDGRCPDGWAATTEEVDRGPSLGPLSIPYCAPPAEERCGAHQMQAAADEHCRPIGSACPAGPFPEAVPPGAVYVLAGAAGGDGSPARPYGSLNQALRTTPSAIALGRGSYSEDVVLAGALEVVGACAEATEIVGNVVLSEHHGLIRDLRTRSVQGFALRAVGNSESTLRGVEVLEAAGEGRGVQVEAGARLRLEDGALLGGGRVRIFGALELVRSELHGRLTAGGSTVSIDQSTLTSTDTRDRLYISDARLAIGRSKIGLPVETYGSARAELRDSWFELKGPPGVEQRSSIVADGQALVVERSTFATRELLVPAPQTEEESPIGQIAIIAHTAAASVEDCLFLLPRVESWAASQAVNVSKPTQAQAAPYRLRRLAVVGGTRQAQVMVATEAQLEDIRCYQSFGPGVLVAEGAVSVARVEAGRTDTGVLLKSSGPLQATLSDLSFGDNRNRGLNVRSGGGSLAADVSRLVVSSAQGASFGLSIESTSPRAMVEVRLRDVKIDAPIQASFELGLDARVDLRNFSFRGAGVGILLRHRVSARYLEDPHHLSFGSISAGVVGVELTELPTDIFRLLDRVRVEAPTLVKVP